MQLGAYIRLPSWKVTIEQHEEAGVRHVSLDEHLIGAVGDDDGLALPGVILHRQVQFRLLLQNNVGAGVDPPELPLPLLAIGVGTRLAHHKGPGQELQVAVDHQILVVDQLPGRMVKGMGGEDVLDIEQIQELGIEGMQAKEGGDAIVEELSLVLDEPHVLRVLFGDDRIVAAHIVESVVHPHVGVEGPVMPFQGGEAVEVGIRLQEIHHRRLELCQLGVGCGVEAVAEEEEVCCQKGQGRNLPGIQATPSCLPGPPRMAQKQHSTAGCQEQTETR